MPRPVLVLILILLGVLVFWFGPIIAVIVVKIVAVSMILAGIAIFTKELLSLIRYLKR